MSILNLQILGLFFCGSDGDDERATQGFHKKEGGAGLWDILPRFDLVDGGAGQTCFTGEVWHRSIATQCRQIILNQEFLRIGNHGRLYHATLPLVKCLFTQEEAFCKLTVYTQSRIISVDNTSARNKRQSPLLRWDGEWRIMTEEGFGDYIRRLRNSLPKRTNQAELARMVRVSRAYIGQIEKASTVEDSGPKMVSDAILRRLANALGVTEREMFEKASRAPEGYRLVSSRVFESLPIGIDEELALRDAGVLYNAGFSELDAEGKRIVLELIRSMNRRRDLEEESIAAPTASKS